jgi:hypothetical protein
LCCKDPGRCLRAVLGSGTQKPLGNRGSRPKVLCAMDLPLASGARDFVVTGPLAGTLQPKRRERRNDHVAPPVAYYGGRRFSIRQRTRSSLDHAQEKAKKPNCQRSGAASSPEGVRVDPSAGSNASVHSPSDRPPKPESASPHFAARVYTPAERRRCSYSSYSLSPMRARKRAKSRVVRP